MKILKRSVPLWVVIVSMLAITGIVIATIIVTQQITTKIQILAAYGMEVYDTDQTTLLTSIDFGAHYRGESFFAPAGFPSTANYFIKNTGEANIWISFSVTNWMNDVEITLKWSGSELSPDQISAEPLVPGGTLKIGFNVKIGNTAPFGTFTPTITLNAHDTAAG